jgi:S1-C subfamily serine protease
MTRSGQTGVPVTVAGHDVIVGFDRNRLNSLAQRWKAGAAAPPRLGLAARDASAGGAEVGRVNPGQPAGRAGVRPGDIVKTVNGVTVRGVDDLDRIVGGLPPDAAYTLTVSRDGQDLQLNVKP